MISKLASWASLAILLLALCQPARRVAEREFASFLTATGTLIANVGPAIVALGLIAALVIGWRQIAAADRQ